MFHLHLLSHTVVIDLLKHLLLSNTLLSQNLLLKRHAPLSTPLLLLQDCQSAFGILLLKLAGVSNLLFKITLSLKFLGFNFASFCLCGIIYHHSHLCRLFFFLLEQAISFFLLLLFAEFNIVLSVLLLLHFLFGFFLIQFSCVA